MRIIAEAIVLSRTREITEAGLFAALIAVLIIAAFYIPVIGSIMGMFLPLPVIILTMKNRPVYVVVSAIVAIILAGMAVTFISSIALGGMALIVGFPMGLAMKYKKKNLVTLLIGSICAAAGFFSVFSLIELTTGISLMQTIETSFKMSMDMQAELTSAVESLGVDSQASLEEAQKLMDSMLYLMKLVMPAILMVMAMFYAAANLVFSHQILKRLNIDRVPLGTFDQFRYPKHLAYGSLGMMLLAFILGYFKLVDAQLISANLAYLFAAIFSVQGMSLIYYWMKKRTGKATGIVLIVLLVFVGMIQYIAFLGFFDVLMDIRKFEKKQDGVK